MVLAPWPYGAADPRLARGVTLVALLAALPALWSMTFRSDRPPGPFAPWPLAGLFALAVLQLVPLPGSVLAVVAPGPASLWHPENPVAASVLGAGPRPISIDPESTRRALAYGTALGVLALGARDALRTRTVALLATIAVTSGALLAAIYGVIARALFGNLLYGSMPVPTVAPFGSFVSKNHFAGYVEMAALLAAGLALGLADEARRSAAALSWVGSARAGRVVVAFGTALAMVLAVLLSLSRAGAVSLCAGAVVLVALRATTRRASPRHRRAWVIAAFLVVLALVALAVLPPEARARLSTLFGMSADNSGTFRIAVWRDAVRLWLRSPFLGHGFGSFVDALPPFKTGLGYVTVEHAESDVIETLAEGGLIGLSLAAAGTVLAARAVRLGFQRQTDRLMRGLGVGAVAGVAALLVHSAFDFNLRIPSNALLFAFLAALALATSGTADPSRRSAGLALGAGALALGVGFSTPSGPRHALPDEVRAFTVEGGRPVTPLRVRQATLAASEAVRRRPANAESWLFLAWLRATTGARDEGEALARYAASLDPQRRALVEAARGMSREGR